MLKGVMQLVVHVDMRMSLFFHAPFQVQKEDEFSSSDSNLNAVVSSIEDMWASVHSETATSCLTFGVCKEMDLAIDMPFANASGQPVHVHGVCNPTVKVGLQGLTFPELENFELWMRQSRCCM